MFLMCNMSFHSRSQLNSTVTGPHQGVLGVVLFSIVTTLPCCVFLFINLTMLYTLRSKQVFRDTSRYVLLFNLLFADTVQLTLSQSLFLLSSGSLTLLYPVCAALTAFSSLMFSVSFVTLVSMCLERYIAVCYPLRHSTIVTTRNTGVVICVIWCVSSSHVIIQLSLMLSKFSFQDLQNMQMMYFCGKESVFLDPASDLYDRAFTYFLFVLGGVTVTISYTGIMVAARSASTDKASASKARRTLLLHLLQMGLTTSSTIYNSLLIVITSNLDRVPAVRLQVVLYVCVIVLPKCLSSLIYGLRDQTIRPILMLNLSCHCRGSVFIPVVQTKNKIRIHVT
ncbi:odorant receptor 131-2-like [Girardinichthys multiradiatus]|uniref:odorant receptor 131-2-like n=1 Tax=Girardinichthys multiradiatus TaxID=208333 RepID=UPI001FAC233C|nr:odorant receptor 131-2-like [Girardinichthys multiradiatus]